MDKVERIRLQNILRPEILNIPAYEDQEVSYKEIIGLEIELKEYDQAEKVAEVINKAMPLPTIIVFSKGDELGLSLAQKRKNISTQAFNVIEDSLIIDHIDQHKYYEEYLEDIQNLKSTNLYEYYKDLYKKTIQLKLKEAGIDKDYQDLHTSQEDLKELEDLKKQIKSLEGQIAREHDLGRRVNSAKQLKNLRDQLQALGG